jgi:hypothetical protein
MASFVLADLIHRPPPTTPFDIPADVLAEAMSRAYATHLAGEHEEAEIVYSAVLLATGRPRQALHRLDVALHAAPEQPQLLALWQDVVEALEPAAASPVALLLQAAAPPPAAPLLLLPAVCDAA